MTRAITLGWIVGSLLVGQWMLLPSTARASDALTQRPFTVRDSIEMERIVGFGADVPLSPSVLYSADANYFLVHTRRGDLQNNEVIDSLLVFDSGEVDAYLDSRPGQRPTPRVAVRRRVTNDSGEIGQVTWLDAHRFGFIAEGNNARNQVFIANAVTGDSTEFSQSSTHVASFAIVSERLVYFAGVERPVPLVVPIENQSLLQILRWDSDPFAAPLRLFRSEGVRSSPIALGIPLTRLLPSHRKIWLSPSGEKAVVLGPAVNALGHWSGYRFPDPEKFAYTEERARSDSASWDLLDRVRFYGVDVSTGVAEPLLDAPGGWLARNCTPLEAYWGVNEESVIVVNSFLSLEGQGGKAEELRKSAPAIFEFNLSTGSERLIALIPPCPGDDAEGFGAKDWPIVSTSWDPGTNVLGVTSRSADGESRLEEYQRSGNQWQRVRTTQSRPKVSFKVLLRQTANTRPRLFASGGDCGCDRELYDPAPQAEGLAFGSARQETWRDKNDLVWRGGLTLPPDHDSRERYPLVVQTHGYHPSEFLIDGHHGVTTAMAAQPLANAGFAVLQIEDNPLADGTNEAELYAEGYRAGIEALVRNGIADPTRVGMIAFSRTGLPVIKLLADQPDLLTAVTIADAGWWGYLLDLILFNYPQDLAVEATALTGGASSSENLAGWIERNPLYRIPRAGAAVRIEANASVLKHWEHYVLLKKAQRPVDLVYFPRGSHVLRKPLERLESQGGTVAWFRFWLMGQVDSAADSAQYKRWCALPEADRDTESAATSAEDVNVRQKRRAACLDRFTSAQ